MGRIVRVASGQSPRNFANSQLFGPLGIHVTHWEGYSQLGLGHGLTDWPNPDGDVPLGFGLWLKPTDMLKIGELYRNGGVYNGNRAELKAELTTGGLFNAMEPVATQNTGYGTINIQFANCQEGSVEFDFPSTGQSGSFNIRRVVDSNVALCEALGR